MNIGSPNVSESNSTAQWLSTGKHCQRFTDIRTAQKFRISSLVRGTKEPARVRSTAPCRRDGEVANETCAKELWRHPSLLSIKPKLDLDRSENGDGFAVFHCRLKPPLFDSLNSILIEALVRRARYVDIAHRPTLVHSHT